MTSEVNEKTPLKKAVSFNNGYSGNTHCVNVVSKEMENDSIRSVASASSTVVSGVKLKRHRRYSLRKPTCQRLVEKSGKRNVRSKHIPRDRYLQDIFTTIIDAKWKWMLLMFTVFYLGSWLAFGFMWWIILITHGEKCFTEVHNFTEAFLLALETSMTIGYGGRQITGECPQATIMLIVQALVSSVIEACIVGLIFTKIARPGKRQSTIVFSEKAVLNKRDDKYCLMFKIADVRKRQLVECHVRLHLFRKYKTLEGIVVNQQDQLRVGMDWYNIRDDSDRLFLISPCNVVHVIDRKSPFYSISKEMYKSSYWELVVILEGVVEATGCSLQTRTSYLPDEVLWGHEFVDMEDVWTENEGILYELKNINKIESARYFMPVCSAREYYTKINRDPDPNDVYGEQDELWDDENFTEPGDIPRVLPTHSQLTSPGNIIV